MSKKRKREKQQSTDPQMEPPSPEPSPDPKTQSPSSGPVGTAGNQSKVESTPPRNNLARFVSFGLLLGVIALLGFIFYEVMASFLVPLFLAALLVVVFRPLHRWVLERCGGRPKVGALLTTAAILLVVLLPLATLLLLALVEGREVISQFNANRVVDGVHQIRTNLGLDMPSAGRLEEVESEIKELQRTTVLRDYEIEQHRSSLFIIEENAREFAAETNRPWPENATESPPADPDDHWTLFVSSLKKARELHFKLPLVISSESETEEKFLEQKREYLKQVNIMADEFSKFESDLLGGKIRSRIVKLVNPSDAEFETYTNTAVHYMQDKLFKLGGNAASFLGSMLLGFAIMVIGLYFFLIDGPAMIESFKGLSPLDDEHEQEIVTEFGTVSRAVVVATLLSALVQGLLAGIGFYFAGLDSIFLLTVLSGLLAMVPFVGAAAVWVPCCIYLYFVDGNLAAAIGLALYGVLVISMADNIIKPLVLHGQSNIHPLLALLSVLGGVATLGPIGILVGPMVVAFLQTMLKILQREMTQFGVDENQQPLAQGKSG